MAADPSSLGGHAMIIQFPNRDPRPIIGIGEYDYYERHAIQKQIVDLLLATGEIFKHDHRLVRIVQYTDSGGAYTRLERVNAVWLLAMVSELARFRKIDGRSGKLKEIDPPKEFISRIMERHRIRELPFPEYKPEGGAA